MVNLKTPAKKTERSKQTLRISNTNYQVPKKARSWGLGILAGLIVVVLPAKYVVLPIRDHYVAQKNAIQQQDAAVKAKIQEGLAVVARPTYYANEQSKLQAALPLYKRENIIRAVSNLALKDNVQITSFAISSSAPVGFSSVGSAAIGHEILILANGQYGAVQTFVHDMQAQPELYQVAKVQISQSVSGGVNTSNNYTTGDDIIDITASAYASN